MDAIDMINAVRAKREANGTNVSFIRSDGIADNYSFATMERAIKFADSLRRKGLTVTSNH